MPQDKVRVVTDAEHDESGFEIETRHYVVESEISRRLSQRTKSEWLMGWRDIARATDRRTLIPSVFPRAAAGNKLPLLLPEQPSDSVVLLACLSSLPCDYTLRQKSSGPSVLRFMLYQAPVLHRNTFALPAPWQRDLTLYQWLHPRVLELAYTSWSIQPWALDLEETGAPYRWNPDRRAVLQAELDGAMFLSYGLSREQTVHILGTFRALRDAETRVHGEYRTERLVLAEYDRMAAAIAAGGVGWMSTMELPAGRGPRHAS
jgi:hypothetical protein